MKTLQLAKYIAIITLSGLVLWLIIAVAYALAPNLTIIIGCLLLLGILFETARRKQKS